nr:class I SAM-dependent methyltransferase [Ureaplasma sp.]
MLKPRLNKICQLINNANYVVDIGSDHAFLSIALIEQSRAKFVTNIEINKSPLNNGYKNVCAKKLQKQINFFLNDGLLNLDLKKEIDYLCISGMGADNIIQILKNNKNNIVKNYILQANTDISKLKYFLLNNGFIISNEIIVLENKRYYEIIQCIEKKSNIIWTNKDYFIGPILSINNEN